MAARHANRRRLPRPFLPRQCLRSGNCAAFQRVPMTDWRLSRSRQRSGNSSQPPSKARANPRPERARTRSWCYETPNSNKKSANERSGSGESPTWRFTADDFRNRALEVQMFPDLVLEGLKVSGAHGGNAEEIQSSFVPSAKAVTTLRLDIQVDFSVGRRPDKQVNEIFPVLVDNRSDRPLFQHIDPTADQGVPGRGEIRDWRRIIQLPIEPRPESMLIAGSEIDQMRNHQRASGI